MIHPAFDEFNTIDQVRAITATQHPLRDECEKLVSLGHTPQGVIELARSLKFIDLMTVAFPRMPSHMRLALYTGASAIVRDAHNNWSVITKD